MAPNTAPLVRLRIVDATRRLIRAPEVTFEAEEMGLDAFGYNIENEILRGSLLQAAANCPRLAIFGLAVEEVLPDEDGVLLRSRENETRFRLVVAADGRRSIVRKAAGIMTTMRDFPQTALAMNFRHSRPHQNVSTEFHTESGPFTLVPLPGNRSSLVCVVTHAEAEALLALDDERLSREVERRAHSILGRMEIESGRGSFPLSIEVARKFADRRIALVGEAGHLLPPIGAQGLNLGIRDAATIAELVADELRAGGDPGSRDVLEYYDERRGRDVRTRALAVEVMNRSLLSDFLPVNALRGLGLQLAGRVGVFRRALMREGLGPQDDSAPRMARGEAL